jgi:hypothetical protein
MVSRLATLDVKVTHDPIKARNAVLRSALLVLLRNEYKLQSGTRKRMVR